MKLRLCLSLAAILAPGIFSALAGLCDFPLSNSGLDATRGCCAVATPGNLGTVGFFISTTGVLALGGGLLALRRHRSRT